MKFFQLKKYSFNKKFFKSSFLFLFAFFIVQPVHAYAGPGASIAAIIVFLTVIVSFLISLSIGFFDFLKKIFKNISSKKKQIKKVKKTK